MTPELKAALQEALVEAASLPTVEAAVARAKLIEDVTTEVRRFVSRPGDLSVEPLREAESLNMVGDAARAAWERAQQVKIGNAEHAAPTQYSDSWGLLYTAEAAGFKN